MGTPVPPLPSSAGQAATSPKRWRCPRRRAVFKHARRGLELRVDRRRERRFERGQDRRFLAFDRGAFVAGSVLNSTGPYAYLTGFRRRPGTSTPCPATDACPCPARRRSRHPRRCSHRRRRERPAPFKTDRRRRPRARAYCKYSRRFLVVRVDLRFQARFIRRQHRPPYLDFRPATSVLNDFRGAVGLTSEPDALTETRHTE